MSVVQQQFNKLATALPQPQLLFRCHTAIVATTMECLLLSLVYSCVPMQWRLRQLRDQVQEGMILGNTISIPLRAVDAEIEGLCNSGETAGKICAAVGKGIEKVKEHIPSSVN